MFAKRFIVPIIRLTGLSDVWPKILTTGHQPMYNIGVGAPFVLKREKPIGIG